MRCGYIQSKYRQRKRQLTSPREKKGAKETDRQTDRETDGHTLRERAKYRQKKKKIERQRYKNTKLLSDVKSDHWRGDIEDVGKPTKTFFFYFITCANWTSTNIATLVVNKQHNTDKHH